MDFYSLWSYKWIYIMIMQTVKYSIVPIADDLQWFETENHLVDEKMIGKYKIAKIKHIPLNIQYGYYGKNPKSSIFLKTMFHGMNLV